MYSAGTDDPRIGVYAVERPDGLFSVLLLNKSPAQQFSVQVPTSGHPEAFQYSSEQYTWHAARANGHPIRNNPP
jgi:hypothetical protein